MVPCSMQHVKSSRISTRDALPHCIFALGKTFPEYSNDTTFKPPKHRRIPIIVESEAF